MNDNDVTAKFKLHIFTFTHPVNSIFVMFPFTLELVLVKINTVS